MLSSVLSNWSASCHVSKILRIPSRLAVAPSLEPSLPFVVSILTSKLFRSEVQKTTTLVVVVVVVVVAAVIRRRLPPSLVAEPTHSRLRSARPSAFAASTQGAVTVGGFKVWDR